MNEKEEMLSLNEQIKTMEEQVWTAAKILEDGQLKVDLELAKLEQDIASDKDLVTGKPMYSNETARKAALKIELDKNEELKTQIQEIKEGKTLIKMQEIELSSLLRKFSILKRLLVPEEK